MAFKDTVIKVYTETSDFIVKKSPEILTGFGITGLFITTILAVKNTPEALRRIGKRKRELNVTKLSKAETFKVTWKCYIPSAITAAISTGCILGSHHISNKRNAALAAAYALSETAFKDYREAVEKTITKKEAEKVKDKIAQDKIEQNPLDNTDVILTGKGNTLFLDLTCGRYFRSDINFVKQAVNEANAELLQQQFISKNEFYAELCLDPTTDGYELGWDATNGLIKVDYSSQIAANGEPCITINYLSSALTKYRH